MAFKFPTVRNITKGINATFGITDTFANLGEPIFYSNETAYSWCKGTRGKTTSKLIRYVDESNTHFTEDSKDTMNTESPYNYLIVGTAGAYGRNFESIAPSSKVAGQVLPIFTDLANTQFVSDFKYKRLVNIVCVGVAILNNPRPCEHYRYIPLSKFYSLFMENDYNRIITSDTIVIDGQRVTPISINIFTVAVSDISYSKQGTISAASSSDETFGTNSYLETDQIRLLTSFERNFNGTYFDNYDWNNSSVLSGNATLSQTMCGISSTPPAKEGYPTELYASVYGPKSFYLVNERYCKKNSYITENGESTFTYYPNVNYYSAIHLACTRGLTVCTSKEYVDVCSYFNGNPTDKIFIPKIDNNGGCNGDYYTSEESETAPQTTWPDDTDYYTVVNVSDDTNDYTDNTELNTPTLTEYDKFNTYYILNGQNVKDLQNYLWNTDDSIFDEIIKGLGLMGENPMNFIINLRQYPLRLNKIANISSANITAGRNINTGVQAFKVNSINSVLDLGHCNFPKYFGNNFLSYSPYTNAKLYIPYCSEVELPTSDFAGHRLSIKLIVDFINGSCRGVVYCDKLIYCYTDGNIGENISVSGDKAGEVASKFITAGVQTASSGVNKDISGIASGVGNMLTASATQVITAGATSPNINLWLPQKCYFIVKMPQQLLSNYVGYAHTIGHACEMYSNLSGISGFTVCDNVELKGFTATEQEKIEIQQLLNKGIYL